MRQIAGAIVSLGAAGAFISVGFIRQDEKLFVSIVGAVHALVAIYLLFGQPSDKKL